MAVLGIITCEILELEFARLLSEDAQVAGITILENDHSRRLIDALGADVTAVKCIPHMHSFRPEPLVDLEVVVQVLDLTLHRNKKQLRKAIQKAAGDISRCIDGLILGYGMCGGTLHDIKEILDSKIPIFFPQEAGHPVDDCVGMMIGGRERYYAQQRKIPGTFFMTAGWAAHWKRLFAGATETWKLKRIFDRYERVLLIVTPVLPQEQMLIQGQEMARRLKLRCEAIPGSLRYLQQTWTEAKKALLHHL